MSERNAQDLQMLAQTFKYFNRVMVMMWRLGLGKFINMAPESAGQIMVLVHTGRKSGKTRHTPVNYALMDGEVYCLAGFGKGSQWYKNIMANPAVEIWLPDSWWKAEAVDVTDNPKRAEILRTVLISSGFAASTFEDLEPREMQLEQFEELFDKYGYRILHIKRTAAKTGAGGPGEYAWVWIILTFFLAMVLLTRHRFKTRNT